VNNINTWLKQYEFLSGPLLAKVFSSIIVIILFTLVQKIIVKLLKNKVKDIGKRHEWEKTSRYIVVFLGTIWVLRVWFEGFESLLTFLGIVSAGLAIALKDLVANIAGWIFIVSRHPFHVGDRVQIGEIHGDVIDIRIFQFTVLEIRNWIESDQSTGRLIHIPNGKVLTEPQANYTQGFKFIWNEISTVITFESDFREAKKITEQTLEKIAEPFAEGAQKEFEEAQKKYLIFYGNITSKVYLRVVNNGIEIIMRYLVPARQRRDSELLIWEEILSQFFKNSNIEFAYNTSRFYYRKDEKDGFLKTEQPK